MVSVAPFFSPDVSLPTTCTVDDATPISVLSRNGFVDTGRTVVIPFTGLVDPEPTLLRKGLLDAKGEDTRSVPDVSVRAERSPQNLSEGGISCSCATTQDQVCTGVESL